VSIRVNDVAPSGLTYSTSPAVYTKGSAITANTPTLGGGGPVVSYAVAPALPAGLSLEVYQEDASTIYLVLPPAATPSLTDEELDGVAGGGYLEPPRTGRHGAPRHPRLRPDHQSHHPGHQADHCLAGHDPATGSGRN